MGAVQRLATVVVLGLVALASVLILYLADEPDRLKSQEEAYQHDAIERGMATYLTQCLSCHGPAGEGYTAPGEAGTGRIGAPIGGDTPNRLLNQTGIVQTGENAGKPWSDPNNPQFGSGLEGRANFIRYRIHNGLKASNGTVLMPAFGQELNGPLNDSQINELVVFIQHADWNEVYNAAIEQNGGYPTAAPKEEPATAAAATPTAAGDTGDGTSITVDMFDLGYNPAELTIPANTDVTINLTNSGALEHTFDITDVVSSGAIPGGGTGSVTVNLPAGTYEYWCAIPGHKEGGMVGTLTVEEGAGAASEGAASTDGGTPGPSSQGAESEPAGTIEVNMVDLAFEPVEIKIAANTDVVVNLTNSGALEHTFTIEGAVDSGAIPGGGTGSVTLNLAPGTYEVICAIPGHKEAGMVATLIVE